ncbi:MAG: hypothetical protein ACE5GW_07390 [Planctomycetota bacterium]
MNDAHLTLPDQETGGFPHPMLKGFGVGERRAMVGIKEFLRRYLKRPPRVAEVVHTYQFLRRFRSRGSSSSAEPEADLDGVDLPEIIRNLSAQAS